MRGAFMAIGLLLLVGGAIAFFGVIEYPQSEHVLKIGGVTASVTHEKTVPQWIGGVAALVGIGLLLAGAASRR
jgi:hypothetical protein